MAKTKVTGGYIADSAITPDHLHTTLDLSTKTLTIGATTVSGHLIPDTNITYDLGSSTNRFRDIYLDGTTINLGGTELKKNSDGDIEFKSGSNFKKLVISELEFDDGTNRKKFKISSGRIKSFDSSGVSDTADKISLSSNTTDDLSEGDNLYFTTARARAAISASTGIAITDGAISAAAVPNASLTNSSVTINSNSLSLGGTLTLDTDDIGEGSTNLYYTTARWDTKMAAADTDDLSEGSTNLYFTNARARGAISVSGNALSYNSSTGVLTANYEESPSFTGNVTVSGTISSGAITASADIDVVMAGNASILSNAVGDYFPSLELKRTSGSSKTNYHWLWQVGSSGFLNLVDNTNSYYPVIFKNNGDVALANDTDSTNPVLLLDKSAESATFAGTISSGAITSTGAIEGTSFSDGTISGITFIDEDSFATNSATRIPTQQSIKAYVDAEVAGVVDSAPAALNTLNELAAALGDDANFSTTTSTALGNRLRVDTASQGLTGTQQANAITNLGITATKAELNYVDGVTSSIQDQLDTKITSSDNITGTAAGLSGTPNITVGTISASGAIVGGTTSSPVGDLRLYDTGNNYLKFYGTGANSFEIDLVGTAATGTLVLNQFNLSTAGTISSGVHTITSTGTIGTTTPANGYLQVTDGSTTLALDPNEIYSSDDLVITTGGDFDIRNGSFSMGNEIVITSSKNIINVGTITASSEIQGGSLDINGVADISGNLSIGSGTQTNNGDANLTIREGNAFAGFDLKSARTSGNIGGIRFYNTSSDSVPKTQLLVETDGSYNFYNGSSGAQNRLTIDSSGNVGINNTNPQTKLHIEGNNVGIPTSYGGVVYEAVDAQIDVISDSSGTWGSAINFVEGTSTTANTDIWSIARKTTGGSGDSSLNFNFGTGNAHDNTNRVAFSSGGNITVTGDAKIGNTVLNPASGFSNQRGFGYASSTGKLEIAATGGNDALVLGRNNSNNGSVLTIRKESNVIGSLGTEGGDSLYIQGGGASGAGILLHGGAGKVLPVRDTASIDATIDLGQSSRRFKDLYLSGTVQGGRGTFVGDGAVGPNALNLLASTNGNGVGITFTDNGSPPVASSGQRGQLLYYHSDGSSYGSGNAFVLTSTESTTTILADGKLMFKEGLYLKPGSGTGAGTKIIDSTGYGVFTDAAIDPDLFTSYAGGIGNIADGSGWGARGLFVHGGGTGDAAAIAHNGNNLYFGIQNGSAANSMSTWMEVSPAKAVSMTGAASVALPTTTCSGSFSMTGSHIYMNNFNIYDINTLSFNDPGPDEGISWDGGNTRIYESPDDLTTNSAGNLQFVYGSTRRLTVNSTGIDVNNTITTTYVDAETLKANDSGSTPGACKLHVGSILSPTSSAVAQFGGFVRMSDQLIVHSGTSSDTVFVKYAGGNIDLTEGEGSGANPATIVNDLRSTARGSGWEDQLNLISSDGTNKWNLLVDNGAGDNLRFGYNSTKRVDISTGGNVDTTGFFEADQGFRQAIAGNDGLRVYGGNANQPLIRVSANTIGANSGDYGFTLAYRGDRSGNENSLAIYSDNQAAGTQIEAINIKQDGTTTFGADASLNGNKLYFNTAAYGVGAGGHNLNSVYVDTLESGSTGDPLELIYYQGPGVNIGSGAAKPLGCGALGVGVAQNGIRSGYMAHFKSTGDVALLLEADSDNVTETDNPFIRFEQDASAVAARIGYASGENYFEIHNEYNSNIYFGTNNGYRAVLGTTGNWTVTGNVTAYGSVSDIRRKENIETIPNAIDKVKTLDGITFNFKDKPEERMTGVIAQQVMEVLPEAVYEHETIEGEETLAVHYGNMVGLLIEGMKEQQELIEKLTARIEELESK